MPMCFFAGKNLQICFMNETASDGSDTESQREHSEDNVNLSPSVDGETSKCSIQQPTCTLAHATPPRILSEIDFLDYQSKLQTEARSALARAKEVAQGQMQIERQKKKRARMSDLVRQSLEKVLLWLVVKFDSRLNAIFQLSIFLVGYSVSLGLSPLEPPDFD